MNKMFVKRRNNCAVCGSPVIEDAVIIGEQYPSAIFVDDPSQENEFEKGSLNLSRCTNGLCSLVQLSNEYDLSCVFNRYPYESGMTVSMSEKLKNVVCSTMLKQCLKEDDVVLDIGGNDGTLLGYVDSKYKRVNIDASLVEQTVKDKDYIYVNSRFSSEVYRSLGLKNPKIIFSVAMLYHLNDPLDFCHNIFEIMSEDTLLVIQVTYLGAMLENNMVDNIVHEHSAYYSLKSISNLLGIAGIKVIDCEFADSYGGSIRVYAIKDSGKEDVDCSDRMMKVLHIEQDKDINSFSSLQNFGERIFVLRAAIQNTIKHISKLYGPVFGFGASTKGNMLLQFLDFKEDTVNCVLDNSPKKIGKYMLGSKIKILDEFGQTYPDYLFVLPYFYTKYFIPIIRKHLKSGQNINLFVPFSMPHFVEVLNS